jgi:predicted dehydrogenase
MSSPAAHDRLGVAVIGCGHWGPNHVRNFSMHKQARVLYCVDVDRQRLEAIRELYPMVRTVSEIGPVLDDPAVQAVVISTPTATHYELSRQALIAGKHVLCEKPLATTTAQAAELVRLARSTGKVLMVGHVFLFNPGIVKLRELIAANELGRLYYLHATRTNLGPIRQDVDCVWDLATHDIAIANYLLDAEPLEASARASHYLQDGKCDVAFITLLYPGNVLANIHVSWLDPKKVRQLTVVGDKKMVTWDDLSPSSPVAIYDKGVVREPYYKDFGEFQLVTREGDVTIPKVRAEEPLRVQTDYFIGCVRSNHIELCSPEQGLAVVRALEAVEASIAAGGNPVRIAP